MVVVARNDSHHSPGRHVRQNIPFRGQHNAARVFRHAMNFVELSGPFFFRTVDTICEEDAEERAREETVAHIHRAKVTLLWYKLRYSVIREVREDADEEG